MQPQMKSKPVAFLLWCLCLLGICGAHRFYLGKYVSGIVWFLTFGLLCVGQLMDLLLLSGQVDVANALIVGRHLKAAGKYPGGGVRAGRPGANRKRCPECAELVQADARKCRFCGADLALHRDADDVKITFCDCPECGHLLEIPSYLVGVPGKCTHCGELITPLGPSVSPDRL